MKKILFVCLGNICRSPCAEAVLRQKACEAGLDLVIDSAGTGDWHVGKPPYAPMQAAASKRVYDLSSLRARQFDRTDFERFDLIVAMDGENLGNLAPLRPSGECTPAVLFTSFYDGTQTFVPDPYYTEDYDGTLDLIEACSDGLVRYIQANLKL